VTGAHYGGVQGIQEDWVELFISCTCTSQNNILIDRGLKREMKLMCERNGIHIPVRQISVEGTE